MAKNGLVRPQRARGIAGFQCKDEADGCTIFTRQRLEFPRHRPRESVRGRIRMTRARAEPREDHRHAAADGPALLKPAPSAQKKHRPRAGGLKGRDVRALKKDLRPCERRREIDPHKAARHIAECGDAGNFPAAKV